MCQGESPRLWACRRTETVPFCWGAFDQADVEFLLLVFDHTTPMLQNITLVDQLASDAADAERQRIALDFHDRVTQPYIGLEKVSRTRRLPIVCASAKPPCATT
jgi:hypothetical protein